MDKKAKKASGTPTSSKAKTKAESDEGSAAKKKAAGFWQFKKREAPQALGSKEIPSGPEDCLAGMDFVITGVLDSIEREAADDLIKRHGGSVKSAVSGKTTYLVVGRDAGASKLAKAKQVGTKQIDEDGLFDLIRNASKKASSKPKEVSTPSKRKVASAKSGKSDIVFTLSDDDEDVTPPSKKQKTTVKTPKKEAIKVEPALTKTKTALLPQSQKSSSSSTSSQLSVPSQASTTSVSGTQNASSSALWVEKYKPKSLKNVVGQHGPASPANKLIHWLQNWYANRKKFGYKATSAGFFPGKGGDGGEYKAVLLSGPPGIGKTTTAILACQEAGLAYTHVNASDNRSKRVLDEQFMNGVSSHALDEYFKPGGMDTSTTAKKILIMDEVDGMAGNEDRGGVAEIIQLIKNSRIPVICICNDRSSQKMRSLAGYCFDLRFQRPRLEQIRGAMMSVCAKEGIKIQPNALDVIIENSRHDIRQVLHNLCMWSANKKSLTYDEAKTGSEKAEKDSIKVGPFDACRNMFSSVKGKYPNSMIDEKMDLYFEDYNFVPLFIHENYLNVQSHQAKNQKDLLKLVAKTADSFSMSDLVDREIRSRQNWSLLPIHAVFTAVIPGVMMEGHLQQQITFPAWLGKNSSTNKNKRLLTDLRTHMHLRVSGNVNDLNLDYLPLMRKRLTQPLAKHGMEGVDDVVQFINSYDLLKEDMESVLELTTWEGMKDKEPLKNVAPNVKAALTRQLNKGEHLMPYSATEVNKKGRGRGGGGDDMNELLDEETAAALANPDDDKEEEETVEKDAMIKVKKQRAAPKRKAEDKEDTKGSAKASTSSGRGAKGGASKSTAGAGAKRGKK